MDQDMTELGYVLKTYRSRHHMSQRNLAVTLGVSVNTIHLWEAKGGKPSIRSLVTLSEVLGIPLGIVIAKSEKIYYKS